MWKLLLCFLLPLQQLTAPTNLNCSYWESKMAVTHVQKNRIYWFSPSGTTHEHISLAGVAAGSLIVVGIGWQTDAVAISSVSDGTNTYVNMQTATSSGDGACAIYYLKNASAGDTTITVTWAANPGFGAIAAHEVSGVEATSDPHDVHAIQFQDNPGTGGNAVTSGSVTTTADGDYIFGFVFECTGNSSDGWTVGTNFTDIEADKARFYYHEYRILATAGGVAATFTSTRAFMVTVTAIGAFKAAAAGGPAGVKTVQGLALASVKTVQGLAIASVKTLQGLP